MAVVVIQEFEATREEYDELRNRIAELERQLSARELPGGKPGERKGR